MLEGSSSHSYRTLCRLGGGGMGEVWLARHAATGSLRAIKTMKEEQLRDPRAREMLVDEARLASKIRHRNVATVLDTAEDAGAPFIVMEWVDGPSLRELLGNLEARQALAPLGVALRIVADACAGLHAAHELTDDQGRPLDLVHRDVSPHNILLSSDGVTKVIDFGVAKARERLSGDTTSSGGLKGKVRYMAPEQALSSKLDRRADLFALGAVLYHLVTGRPAFEGANDLAILHDLLTFREVAVPDHVPEPVARIIARSLTPSADARFGSADEMRAAIESAMVTLGLYATELEVAAFVLGTQSPEHTELQSRLRVALATQRPAHASVASPAPAPVRPKWRRAGVLAAAAAAALFVIVLGDASKKGTPPGVRAASAETATAPQAPALAPAPVMARAPVIAAVAQAQAPALPRAPALPPSLSPA
ncbi:MAG: serine/threonine protein kinase, partial [Myxococcales bacterium]|nr:serine/threonine protein kinase [Myxococcales bacterium]